MDKVNKTRSIAVDSNNKLVFPQISELIEANPELGGGEILDNIVTDITDLQQTKSNRGEFWFEGGSLVCENKFQLNAFSCVWTATLNVSDLPTTKNSTWVYTCKHVANSTGFHVGVHQPAENKRPYMWLQFYYYDSTNTNHYISKNFAADCYDGKSHTYAVIFNGSLIKFLIDNELKLSATLDYDFVPRDCSYPLTIGAITHKISRIKYFNFDMSANDAPYTIADYIAGKDESPLLLKGTQKILDNNYTNWEMYNKSSFEISQDSNADTLTATCISPTNYCTFSDGWKSGLKTGDVVTVSWESIEISSGVSVIGTRTNSATNGNVEIANGGTFVQQADSQYIYFQVNLSSNVSVGDTITVKGLCIRVNGALLSLTDYSVDGKVLDISGNNNHATITGAVYGSKSSSVETFVETVIGNSTDNSDKIQVSDDGIKLIGATTIVDSDDITYFGVTPDDDGGRINANAEFVYIKSAGVDLISGETGALYIGDESSPSVMAIYTPAGTWSYDSNDNRDILQFAGTDISRFKINTLEIENTCNKFTVQAGSNIDISANQIDVNGQTNFSKSVKLSNSSGRFLDVGATGLSFTGNDYCKELYINYDSGISMQLMDSGEDTLNNEVLINNSTGITITPSLDAQLKHKVGNVHIDGSSISINPTGNSDDWGSGRNPELFECGHKIKITNTGIDLYDKYNWLALNINAKGIWGGSGWDGSFNISGVNNISLRDQYDSASNFEISSYGLTSKCNERIIGSENADTSLYYAKVGKYELTGLLTTKTIYKASGGSLPATPDYTNALLDKLSTQTSGEVFNPETESYDFSYVKDISGFDTTAVGLDYFYNVIKELNARIKELESASGSSTDPVDQIKLKVNGTNEYCIVKAEKDENGAITLTLE